MLMNLRPPFSLHPTDLGKGRKERCIREIKQRRDQGKRRTSFEEKGIKRETSGDGQKLVRMKIEEKG